MGVGATGTAKAPDTAMTAALNRDRDLADLMKSLQLGVGDKLWEDVAAEDTTDMRPQGMLKPALLIPDFITSDTGNRRRQHRACVYRGRFVSKGVVRWHSRKLD